MNPTERTSLSTQQTMSNLTRLTSGKPEIRTKAKTRRPTRCLDISRARQLKPSEIKRPLIEAERLRLRTVINRSCTPFVYELNSAESNLTQGFAYICTQLDLHDTFFAVVPSRIGFDRAVDSAANALIHLFADVRRSKASETLCTRKYAHAVTLVRQSMLVESWRQSDAALLAIFLLAFHEHKLRHEKRLFSDVHRNGMCALLLTQAAVRSDDDTELVRSLLYQAWSSTFLIPCIQGTKSPFDEAKVLDLNPPSQLKLPPEVGRLRKISNQLIIRLPALIASVRRLRRSDADETLRKDAIDQALKLLALRDKDGESAVLHRVKIVQTASESPLSTAKAGV